MEISVKQQHLWMLMILFYLRAKMVKDIEFIKCNWLKWMQKTWKKKSLLILGQTRPEMLLKL